MISEGQETIKLGKVEVNARGYCARFNFAGTDQQKKVKDLSGGERNRVHLARMLKEGANLIILDEPTNDLDVNTLRALEEGLEVSPAAPSSAVTTAGFWTGSRLTSWRSKATARWSGTKATTASTTPIGRNGSARKPISRIGFGIGSSRVRSVTHMAPRAVITGAAGLIGQYLVQTASRWAPGWTVQGLARAQLDLTDTSKVDARIRALKPDLIIHCAAFSRTKDCEQDPAKPAATM